MSKREFLQLAHSYNPQKYGIGGWYISDKLDGMRAYWDGGWTRGKLTSQVPFANTQKDYRRVTPPHSTGLWSRYGKPIAAPSWWLDKLPDFPLDGELYLGLNKFQELISTVKKFEPDSEAWENINYYVFDLPSDYMFLAPGKINNPQWSITFDDMRDLAPPRKWGPLSFYKVCQKINQLNLTEPVIWLPQIRLPQQTIKAQEELNAFLDYIVGRGGEGVMLRKNTTWEPKRSHNLLKLKPWLEGEATVIDYIWGKGKLEGLMGAMIIKWQNKTFELSGFTNEERQLHHKYTGWTIRSDCEPGKIAGVTITSEYFPRGSIITFRYRELTDSGIPKEARYWRKR